MNFLMKVGVCFWVVVIPAAALWFLGLIPAGIALILILYWASKYWKRIDTRYR